MRRFILSGVFAVASVAPALAKESAANVHRNYNMGTAEYFVGSTETGGFGFNCQDKTQDGYKERYMIAFILPDGSPRKGDKVVFSRGGEKLELALDSSEAISFDGHKNWKDFTRIWKTVRFGDTISVVVGSSPPMNLATTGAAEVMPAKPCGE